MLRVITTLFLLTGLFLVAQAQSIIPQDVKDNIKLRVDNGQHPGIVVGMIDGDQIVYYSYGVKSLPGKDTVDERTVFEIGSISKTFTGILLADQVVKKKMSIDDPLQKYLPQGVTAPTRNGASIKLVNLSNHTSALPRLPGNLKPANPSNPYADYSETQLYDFLKSYELTRDIGSQYEYSNYAVGLLGHVLATQQRTTYEALMVEVIARPLGMEDTRIVFTPTMKKNLAMGYANGTQVENWDLTTLAGAGAIRSTAADMLKYVRANMGKTKSKLYPAMQLTHKHSRPEGTVPMVGLGWHMSNAGTDELIWHNGGTGGYRSFAGFVKGGTRGVVVLTNSTAGVDDIGMHLLSTSIPLVDAKASAANAGEQIQEVAVDEATLETYVGEYELVQGFILTVTRAGAQLNAQATGQGQFPVFAKSKNVFFYKVVVAQLTFNQNATGVVESVTLNQGGQQITGKKLPKK
jgi:D-alanyl-D-alanine-carboxypeptidase/D-alanyl-D-alanine-endopeptidase